MKIYSCILIILVFCSIGTLNAQPAGKKNNDVNIRVESDQSQKGSLVFSGADEGEYIKLSESGEGFLYLSGNIKMQFNGNTVYSNNVVYNRNTGDVTLTGDILLDDGKNKIHASKCVFNVKNKAGVLYDAKSIEKPFFFDTNKIRIVNQKTYITDKTNFTTCELERPHYHFLIKKLTVYQDKRAIAYNAVYVVGDLPVFYLPVIAHSDDGIGIITQFGQGTRRGSFMQNTMKYTSEDGDKWKYKLDVYEKLGYYGGVEYSEKSKDHNTFASIAGAKFKNANLSGTTSSPGEQNENWYKIVLNNDSIFNTRESSTSFSSIKFEWMNDWEFDRYFEARREPQTTSRMFAFLPPDIKEKPYLNWNYAIGDRGVKHEISLQFARQWYWDQNIPRNKIDNYSTNGRYVPFADQLPIFNFKYTDSFYLFDYKGISDNTNKQKINWIFYAGGNSYKQYSQGNYYSTTYTPYTYLLINTDIPFLKYFTYTPGIQNGVISQWVKGPFNNDYSAKDSAETAAKKNSYQYAETSNSLKFGLSKYYLQVTHYYRRSYNEGEVVEPFVHEKRNNFVGGLFFLPDDDIKMSVLTSYDARRKYSFEDERLKDIAVSNSIFLDFCRFFYDSKSSSNRNAGLFYSGLEATNNYLYITKDATSGYNTFDIKFTTGNFSLPGIERIRNFEIGYNFFHDYRFSFRDIMSLKWGLYADIFKLWRLEIGGMSQADRAHSLYSEDGENFFDELKKSLYFYDRERSKDSSFTLRNFFVNIIHDLHCWEIGFYYTLQRKIENYGPGRMDKLMYYEQIFFVSLTLKTFSEGFQKTPVYPLQQRHEAQH